MSLDSSDSFPKSLIINIIAEDKHNLSGKKEHPGPNWVFLFTHRQRIDKVNEILKKKFETFVHKSIVYQRRAKGKVLKKEIPTISGLIFIKAEGELVRNYLHETFPGIHLVKNHSTGKTAEISPKEMDIFMKLSSAKDTGIRFMLHPIDYYAKDHHRIRITSGDFEGCEGYIVRIHRDRKLITQIGNMTVAISGVAKESFENADDFLESIRIKNKSKVNLKKDLSSLEQELERYFFTPANDLEAMALSQKIATLPDKLKPKFFQKNKWDFMDAIYFTLSQIADRFEPKYFKSHSVGIHEVCVDFIKILKDLTANPATGEDTKEKILVGLESLMLRHPVLPIDEVMNITQKDDHSS